MHFLGVVYFNHKNGCQKCFGVGTYDHSVRRVCFADFSQTKRTDKSFRDRLQPIHHKERSVLEDLMNIDGSPLIDMIKSFPTSDPLHLLDEGVMKRMINIWIKGTTIYRKKWSREVILSLSSQILLWNKEFPSDINRKIRALQFVKFWKATEFRSILLYLGIVAFKDILDQESYIHFLNLCLASRICSSRTYVRNLSFKRVARRSFEIFCTNYVRIYGNNAVVSNIHNIAHIFDDVDHFGSLSGISTYPFENHLREIKLRVRPSNTPIQQVTRRLAEMFLEKPTEEINFGIRKLKSRSWVPEMRYEFNLSNKSVFKYIRITPNVFLSTKKLGDKWLLTKTGDIVEMKYAFCMNNSYAIVGSPMKRKKDFFDTPYASNKTDIYLCDGEKNEDKIYEFNEVKAKLMCLSYKESLVFLPMLHSVDECNEFFSNH